MNCPYFDRMLLCVHFWSAIALIFLQSKYTYQLVFRFNLETLDGIMEKLFAANTLEEAWSILAT